MSKNFSIQIAEPRHFQEIAILNIAAYSEFAKNLSDEAWAQMQSNLGAIDRVTQRAQFLIISIDENIAGSVAYCPPGKSIDPIPPDWASILLLAVSPDYRGRGIARSLVQECIYRARLDTAQTVGLFTSELMSAARQIYLAQGFSEDCEISPRLGLRYWRYRLDLTSKFNSMS
jgi:ribosomal protein S18 acetylase RimI-like enzyme